MISNFIKKLLFARQFYFNEGNIEIMKMKKLMIAPEIIYNLKSDEFYSNIKENVKQEFHEIANNLGSERKNIFNLVESIFEIYGLGKIEIKELSDDKAKIHLFNSTIAHTHLTKNNNSDKPVCHITNAVLSGIFSFLFNDDVYCKETKCYAKGDEFCEFEIKRGVSND